MNTRTETYQGWANRETWAFNLHWSYDQGLYGYVQGLAQDYLHEHPDASDYFLGQAVVSGLLEYLEQMAEEEPDAVWMVIRGVGSFWRVNETEVGASVRESLDNES